MQQCSGCDNGQSDRRRLRRYARAKRRYKCPFLSVALDCIGDTENYPSVVTIYINAPLASRLQKTPRVSQNPWGLGCLATVGTDTAWQSKVAPTGNGDGCTTYDPISPTITVLPIPTRAILGFAVTWSAQDNLSGVSHDDVQYRDDMC